MSRPHWPGHFFEVGGTKRAQERRACHENILDLTSGAGDYPRRRPRFRRRAGKTGARRATRGRQRRAAAAAAGFRHRKFHQHAAREARLYGDPPRGKPAYPATAGTLAFYDQSGEQSAAVFYTAYVAKDAGANRPLTFVFNGGPGAGSAFPHLGLVGPRILDLGPDGRDAATATLRDNPDTWLAFSDLVLIDPIGTGWSR